MRFELSVVLAERWHLKEIDKSKMNSEVHHTKGRMAYGNTEEEMEQ